MSKGTLFILSGPSGAGKGTVLKEVLAHRDDLFVSISATTRAPRPGEVDGVNYYFVSKEQFEEMIEKGQVLEYATYCDNYYGTPLKAVQDRLNEGKDVVLEIEVVGAGKVKKIMPEAVCIFIVPPSMEVLAQRLRGRQTEEEEVVQKRLAKAKEEVGKAHVYDYIVINDSLDDAVREVEEIMSSQKYKTEKRLAALKENY